MSWLYVFLGGGLGAMARHAAVGAASAWAGPGFPWGTLLVNVAGCFALGWLVAALGEATTPGAASLRLLLATGLLGGFTTFSAFSVDALALYQRGEGAAAAAYVAASLVLSLAAAGAGMALGR